MDARAIALAIPFFFLMIGIELYVNKRRGDPRYRFHDSINSLSCGIGEQMLGVFFAVVHVGGYTLAWQHLRLTTIPRTSVVAWIALLFGVDLAYYLYHWASHRVNFLWAAHSVHHQSEEYNLSTALRQSWFTALASWTFYVPLAIAGFPPEMYVVMHTLNTLYQFWIHTRSIGKLGFLESFLNTPSHHRVHHGTDPIYIDKNYAGIFILWDRFFGTFIEESREPVYGTVKPLASWNPIWANVEPYVHIAKLSGASQRLRDKLYAWIAPPEWRPANLGGDVTVPEVSRAEQQKYDVDTPRGLDWYVVASFLVASGATTGVLWFDASLPRAAVAAIVGVIVLTLLTWGALFEAKPWAVPLEWARLATSAAIAAWLARGTAAFVPVAAGASIAALGFAIWVGRYRGRSGERRAIPNRAEAPAAHPGASMLDAGA